MNNENHTVDWFINFFEAIPEDKWCVDVLGNARGQRCAYGHLNHHRYGHWRWGNGKNFALLTEALDRVLGAFAAAINNGRNPRYPQPTPKLRILAALHDIKRQQEEAAEAFELRPLNLSKPVQRKELV